MRLISCLMFISLIEIHNARQRSSPPNIIRIPLTRSRSKMIKQNSAHARSKIDLDDTWAVNLGKISIGQPQQHFNVIFDTGSDDLWVFSSHYDSCDPNSNTVFSTQSTYNHDSSSTYQKPISRQKQPKALVIGYSSGWVFGFKAIDVITMAGSGIQGEFLEVTKTTEFLAQSRANGVFGLTYDPKKGNLISMMCDKINGERKFSFYLPKYKGGNVTAGELLLCGEDTSKYDASTMTYVKDTHPGFWFILIDSIQVDDSNGSFQMSSQIRAVVDTGTNRIVGPKKNITKFLNIVEPYLIGNHKEQQVDCKYVHLLPNLTFTIEGTKFTFKGRDYILKDRNYCRIDLLKGPPTYWTFGEPFLRKYYSVFDMKNHRIGFAESKE